MNIANFIEWFITQFIAIATNMLGKLDQITIYSNVSLMDFIITITIVGIFIEIVLTIPSKANKFERRYEKTHKEQEE